MSSYSFLPLLLLLWFTSAFGRKVGHNKLYPINARVGPYVRRFAPFFSYEQGCKSYPAVNQAGDYSGGLKASGSPGGKCRENGRQQTYVRVGVLSNKFAPAKRAIMYAQFFPKDQGTRPPPFGRIKGHRYDWEEVIVFVRSNGKIEKAAASSHGGYKTIRRSATKYWAGDRVKVCYGTKSFKNNAFYFCRKTASEIPMVSWRRLSQKAREAITDTNWGKASPKFTNAVFASRIRKAWGS